MPQSFIVVTICLITALAGPSTGVGPYSSKLTSRCREKRLSHSVPAITRCESATSITSWVFLVCEIVTITKQRSLQGVREATCISLGVQRCAIRQVSPSFA
eukprot:Mycagemm_TRINITY_DN9714_c0_g1::TRINITY_DN9714_c0_g1_i1::g.4821::m.4821 type:complete len:101 gc:universal TRINITY_DN9714_c0_g1_i1:107-409(+)